MQEPTSHRYVVAAISALLFLEVALCIGCGPSSVSETATTKSEKKQQPSTRNEVASKADSDTQDGESHNRPLDLLILSPEVEKGAVSVTLEITNRGTEPIIWDREFSVFLTWKLTLDDGQVLRSEEIENHQLETGEQLRQRFVTVLPGQSLTKKFALTKSMRIFMHARKSVALPDGGSETFPVAGEQLVRYVIPPDSRVLRISVEYDGNDSDAGDGFSVYFRQRPEAIGVASRHVKSSQLKIQLK